MSKNKPLTYRDIFQALLDGKQIQAKDVNSTWMDLSPRVICQFIADGGCSMLRIGPVEKTGWVVVYSTYVSGVWQTKKDALESAQGNNSAVAIIQVTYTEGEGLE